MLFSFKTLTIGDAGLELKFGMIIFGDFEPIMDYREKSSNIT